MKLETKFTTRSYAGKERTYVCSLTSPNKKDFVLQIGGQVVYLDVSGVMALHEMLSKACKPKLEVAPGPEPEEPEAESEEVPEPEPESEADPEAPEPEPEKNPNAKARRGKGK